jgi:hypothetical protein
MLNSRQLNAEYSSGSLGQLKEGSGMSFAIFQASAVLLRPEGLSHAGSPGKIR